MEDLTLRWTRGDEEEGAGGLGGGAFPALLALEGLGGVSDDEEGAAVLLTEWFRPPDSLALLPGAMKSV